MITDHWEGIEQFFEPEREILVAHSGEDVARIFRDLTPERARGGGGPRACAREHTAPSGRSRWSGS